MALSAKHNRHATPPMSKTKSIPLSSLRYIEKVTIAELDNLKAIMRVKTARTVKWYLVLPAVGDSDSRCVLLHRVPKWEHWHHVQLRIFNDYAARIVKTYQLA